MLTIEKYSFGVGDRFAHQAAAQLRAFTKAAAQGVEAVPVWNKSYREHSTIGSAPSSVRGAARVAIEAAHWEKSYYVDADHIRLETVDAFIPSSDFYTIDVADFIGQPIEETVVEAFVSRHPELIGTLVIPGVENAFTSTSANVAATAAKYLLAVREAGKLYRHIAQQKGEDNFVTEVSMDETDAPQTPPELLVILAALADEQIPVQTIAPKFTGRFNKGVDYVGDLAQFEREFNDDLAVIAYAVAHYDLPKNLKLSVHSGSDKFSLYPIIRRALDKTGAGLHIKTAGTTWLEEVIGLAEADGEALQLAKDIYAKAYAKREELCAPYATVIDIDAAALPSAETVQSWTSEQYVSALRHDQSNPQFNPSFRQLIHVGYKVAAQLGERYLVALDSNAEIVGKNVMENLYERHLKPLFIGE